MPQFDLSEFCEVLIQTNTVNLTRDDVHKIVSDEVRRITNFYETEKRITANQAVEIEDRAIKRLTQNWITDLTKIKLITKDYVIFVLSREFNKLKQNKIIDVIF